jgi:DNA-binding CsgD family transcriptional regulator
MATRVQIKPSYEWSKEAATLGISHRELEVFALVAEGFSNKEVAEILHIKHQSVKNHMHSFTKKLGVKNTVQAVVVAIHLNLISVEERIRYNDTTVDLKLNEEGFIKACQQVIDGEIRGPNITEKSRRALKVFLRAHGIDVDGK